MGQGIWDALLAAAGFCLIGIFLLMRELTFLGCVSLLFGAAVFVTSGMLLIATHRAIRRDGVQRQV
jgi:hypothetical protein